jgi:hypothetical protein
MKKAVIFYVLSVVDLGRADVLEERIRRLHFKVKESGSE